MQKSFAEHIHPHKTALTDTLRVATRGELFKIEHPDGSLKSLHIPASILSDLESSLERKVTEEDAREILHSPSVLAGIESKLNYEMAPSETENKKKKLALEQVRELLLSNGVAEKRLKNKDLDVFYLEAGDPSKETILLVHGIASSSYSWRYQILELKMAGYHVIAIDLPGHGESPHPGEKCTHDFYTDLLGKFLDGIHVEKVILGGSSMGAWISEGFAKKNLSRIDKFIGSGAGGLTDRNFKLELREFIMFPQVARILAPVFHKNKKVINGIVKRLNGDKPVSEDLLQSVFTWLANEDKPLVLADYEFINDQIQANFGKIFEDGKKQRAIHKEVVRGYKNLHTDIFDILNEANIPSIWAHGKKDSIFTYEEVERVAKGRATVIPFDSGHGPHTLCPNEFNLMVLDFLRPDMAPDTAEKRSRFKDLMHNIRDRLMHSE